MGNFYTNLLLRGPADEAVLDYVKEQKRTAFVSPTRGDLTIVYDREVDSQNLDEMHGLGAKLSEKFRCPVLGSLNHDDDILYLAVYRDGNLLAEYSSREGSRGPIVRSLSRAFGVTFRRRLMLWMVLHVPWFIFESLRHALICRLLKVGMWPVAHGYKYLQRGEAVRNADGTEVILFSTSGSLEG